jgi:hypothetical protein
VTVQDARPLGSTPSLFAAHADAADYRGRIKLMALAFWLLSRRMNRRPFP